MFTSAIGPLTEAIAPSKMLNTFLGGIPGFIKGTMVLAVLTSALHALPASVEVREVLNNSVFNNRTSVVRATIVPELPGFTGRTRSDVPVSTPGGVRANAIQFPVDLNPQYDYVTEVQMLAMLNNERANVGLEPLVSDEALQNAARGHSSEMFQLGYFAHQSPTAGSPFDRMEVAGAQFNFAGENLAFAPNVEKAHRGLMNSAGHRANILQPEYRRVGIGVTQTASGVRMFTQNFAD